MEIVSGATEKNTRHRLVVVEVGANGLEVDHGGRKEKDSRCWFLFTRSSSDLYHDHRPSMCTFSTQSSALVSRRYTATRFSSVDRCATPYVPICTDLFIFCSVELRTSTVQAAHLSQPSEPLMRCAATIARERSASSGGPRRV